MLDAAVRADLWDIEQQGSDAFVDSVRGQVGFNRVTVPVLVGPAAMLRLRPFASPHWFSTGGGLCFRPDSTHFSATRLRPVVAEWLKSRDPLADLADTAERSDLPLSAELTCRHHPALLDRLPHAAVKNCFGEPVEHHACLNNPDVREFLVGVVANVSQTYKVRSFTLRDVFGAPAGGARAARSDAGRPRPAALDPVATWLLEQCFCESCRQQLTAADLDPAYLCRRACMLLENAFASGSTSLSGLDELWADDADFRAFDAWSAGQVVALLQTMVRRGSVSLTVEMDDGEPSTPPRPIRHSDLSLCWSYPCFERTADAVPSLFAAWGEAVGLDRLTLRFTASPACTPDAPTLVRLMTHAAEAGVRRMQIDDYGTTPTARLDWMRQALRSATRTAQASRDRG